MDKIKRKKAIIELLIGSAAVLSVAGLENIGKNKSTENTKIEKELENDDSFIYTEFAPCSFIEYENILNDERIYVLKNSDLDLEYKNDPYYLAIREENVVGSNTKTRVKK